MRHVLIHTQIILTLILNQKIGCKKVVFSGNYFDEKELESRLEIEIKVEFTLKSLHYKLVLQLTYPNKNQLRGNKLD